METMANITITAIMIWMPVITIILVILYGIRILEMKKEIEDLRDECRGNVFENKKEKKEEMQDETN